MDIRTATPADYDRIVDVMDAWWGRPVRKILPRLFLNHFWHTSFVAEDGDVLHGFLVGFLSGADPRAAYVHAVAVAPEHRRTALAATLYRRFFDLAAAGGHTVVNAVTSPFNDTSIAFHTALGFSVSEPVVDYDGPGLDRVVCSPARCSGCPAADTACPVSGYPPADSRPTVGNMAMNVLHRVFCNSGLWASYVAADLLPWVLSDIDLGPTVLEIGPGYGANLRALAPVVGKLTALELSADLADGLRRRYADRAAVVTGDGTAMPFPDNEYSAVVCFTMLHHVPTAELQQALFAEAFRVLAPGGTFAGSDGVDGLGYRLVHVGDTYNPVPPLELPARLSAVGFVDVDCAVRGLHQRFRARKPR